MREPVGPVANVLYPAIRGIVSDAVLQRSERCGSGLELWRRLFSEMRGAAPQIAMVQAEQFQFPQRAPSANVLWDYLERWLALGTEVEGSGYETPEWMKAASLLRLVPKDMEATIVARPELRTYAERLSWVRAQLAHLRANSQAQALERNKNDDAMVIGTLGVDGTSTDDPLLARLAALEAVFQKGKGKGGGGGAGGAGGQPFRPPTGANGGGKGAGGAGGKGGQQGLGAGGAGGGKGGQQGPACWFCNKPGHRRSECPLFTAHLQAKGKGRGSGDQVLNDLGGGEAGGDLSPLTEEECNAEEWCLGDGAASLYELSVELPPPPPAFCAEGGGCACRPRSRVPRRPGSAPLRLLNRFQALEATDADEEEAANLHVDVLTVEGRCGEGQLLCGLEQPAVGKKPDGWKEVVAVVDSGAEETVVPPGLLPGPVAESPMQRAGGRYRAANGARIPNLGQQRATFKTAEGQRCSLMFQVAGVERPLVSVSQLARTGHRVEFGAAEGAIVNQKTGRKIRLQRVGGVYVLRMRVRDEAADRQSAGFSRPGR